MARINLQHGQVIVGAFAKQFGVEGTPILQRNCDLVSVIDNVSVGHDIPLGSVIEPASIYSTK